MEKVFEHEVGVLHFWLGVLQAFKKGSCGTGHAVYVSKTEGQRPAHLQHDGETVDLRQLQEGTRPTDHWRQVWLSGGGKGVHHGVKILSRPRHHEGDPAREL